MHKEPDSLPSSQQTARQHRGEDRLRTGFLKFDQRNNELNHIIWKQKLKDGMSKTANPPPSRSIPKDLISCRILRDIEPLLEETSSQESSYAKAILYLYEQSFYDPKEELPAYVQTRADLNATRNSLISAGSTKRAKDIELRLEHRSFLRTHTVQHGFIVPPVWDKTSTPLKTLFIHQALSQGNFRPFTVNPTEKVIAGACKLSRGLGSVLQDRLRRYLTSSLNSEAPEFWFLVEQGGRGGIHLHGAIAWPTAADVQEIVRRSLISLSGEGRGPNVNVSLPGPVGGWVNYSTKFFLTQRLGVPGLPNKVFYTKGIRKAGQQEYETFRTHVLDEIKRCR